MGLRWRARGITTSVSQMWCGFVGWRRCPTDRRRISAPIPSVACVERLVKIADQVGEPPKRIPAPQGWIVALQFRDGARYARDRTASGCPPPVSAKSVAPGFEADVIKARSGPHRGELGPKTSRACTAESVRAGGFEMLLGQDRDDRGLEVSNDERIRGRTHSGRLSATALRASNVSDRPRSRSCLNRSGAPDRFLRVMSFPPGRAHDGTGRQLVLSRTLAGRTPWSFASPHPFARRGRIKACHSGECPKGSRSPGSSLGCNA